MAEATTQTVEEKKSAAKNAAINAMKSLPTQTPVVEEIKAETPKIVETAKALISTEKKASPKAKSTLGVPEDWSVAWVPYATPPEFSAMIKKVARVRDCNVTDIYVKIIKDALTPELIKELEAEAEKAPEPKTASLSSKTPEQLQAAQDRAQKQLDAIKAKLDAIKNGKKE